MLGVFSDGTEVIVCEVDDEGKPLTNGYFKPDSCDRNREDYDYALVEGPVRMERGSLMVVPDRILTGSV